MGTRSKVDFKVKPLPARKEEVKKDSAKPKAPIYDRALRRILREQPVVEQKASKKGKVLSGGALPALVSSGVVSLALKPAAEARRVDKQTLKRRRGHC